MLCVSLMSLSCCIPYVGHMTDWLSLCTEQVRQRVTNLVCKAYKTIKLSDLCTLLGQSEEQVKQGIPAGQWPAAPLIRTLAILYPPGRVHKL